MWNNLLNILNYLIDPDISPLSLVYIKLYFVFLLFFNGFILYLNKLEIPYIHVLKLNILLSLSIMLLFSSFDCLYSIPRGEVFSNLESSYISSVNLPYLLKFLWLLSSLSLLFSIFGSSPLLQALFPLAIIQSHGYLLNLWTNGKVNDILINNDLIKWTKIVNKDYCLNKLNIILEDVLSNKIKLSETALNDFLSLNADAVYSKSKSEIGVLLEAYYEKNIVYGVENNLSEKPINISLDLNSIIKDSFSYSTSLNLILLLLCLTSSGFLLWKFTNLLNFTLPDFSGFLFTENAESTPLSTLDLARQQVSQLNSTTPIVMNNLQNIGRFQQQFNLLNARLLYIESALQKLSDGSLATQVDLRVIEQLVADKAFVSSEEGLILLQLINDLKNESSLQSADLDAFKADFPERLRECLPLLLEYINNNS